MYEMLIAPCCACRRMFTSNPHLVPSIRMTRGGARPAGAREPLCQTCAETLNARRIEAGLKPFPIHPEAYEAQEV